jgi:uncharacterized protein
MLRRASPFLRYSPYLLFLLSFLLAYSAWLPLTRNPDLPRIVALAMLIFGVVDWLLLAFLPRLGLSYGSIELAWLLMLCGRVVYLLAIILPLNGLFHFHMAIRSTHTDIIGLVLWGLINLAACAIEYYSLYIEPFDLRVTTLQVPGPAFSPKRPVRILQLADLHIERITKRDLEILERVKALKPDLIVLTGDYLNYDYASDPRAIRDGRAFLSQLQAPRGVYAIPGSHFVDRPEVITLLFADMKITVLKDQAERIKIGSGEIYLMGVVNQDRKTRDRNALSDLMKQKSPGVFSLLLYHTPDLIEAAAENGVNLYLAGHTHGGQIRFPLIGAVITLSAYGRKYASGQHTLGATTLYTSRGLGMEGLNLPRARFLCPPEMVVIELGKNVNG